MTLDELHGTKLKPNEIILDVRGPDEYAEGHIPGALNIPVDQVAARADEIKHYDQVFIHCKRGGRAQTAFNALKAVGLKNVVCVADAGMDAWIERGYPVAR
jgi:rhodanese-related sulfurtransferase